MGSTSPPILTTTIQPPPGPHVARPTSSDPFPAQNPSVFTDAMIVRTKVFIEEQKCSAEGELDEDDARSWQWVVYSTPTAAEQTKDEKEGRKIPIAVIRLVPPPHEPHEALLHPEKKSTLAKYELSHEPYVKLTRVAVLKEYRGTGLGRVLVETALNWAAENPAEIDAAYARVVDGMEGKKQGKKQEKKQWTGLALVHAQVQVEKMYERLGFVTDDTLGRWDEEGIEHVGMWRRVDVQRS